MLGFTRDHPLKSPPEPHVECLAFVFHEQHLVVTRSEKPCVPVLPFSQLLAHPMRDGLRRIGTLNTAPCFVARWTASGELPMALEARELRSLHGALETTELEVAGLALHLLHCDRTQAFCGICGAPTAHALGECARVCSACGHLVYARVSPSVIVAVTRGDELLLARGTRFPRPVFSVLAGFVEPGETLEECVHREVREEVGIEVEHLKYFGSQPWPFPDSLMVGFTAEYAGGELTPDPAEIAEVRWFRPDARPLLPSRYSIARRLIDRFIDAE